MDAVRGDQFNGQGGTGACVSIWRFVSNCELVSRNPLLDRPVDPMRPPVAPALVALRRGTVGTVARTNPIHDPNFLQGHAAELRSSPRSPRRIDWAREQRWRATSLKNHRRLGRSNGLPRSWRATWGTNFSMDETAPVSTPYPALTTGGARGAGRTPLPPSFADNTTRQEDDIEAR